jgi:hypothetical protein
MSLLFRHYLVREELILVMHIAIDIFHHKIHLPLRTLNVVLITMQDMIFHIVVLPAYPKAIKTR